MFSRKEIDEKQPIQCDIYTNMRTFHHSIQD